MARKKRSTAFEKGFKITQEELDVHKAIYYARCGKIKKMEPEKISGDFSPFFQNNSLNRYNF